MKKPATALVVFVALEHILFLVLEMFFRVTPALVAMVRGMLTRGSDVRSSRYDSVNE